MFPNISRNTALQQTPKMCKKTPNLGLSVWIFLIESLTNKLINLIEVLKVNSATPRRCDVAVASRLCILTFNTRSKSKGRYFVKYAKSQSRNDC